MFSKLSSIILVISCLFIHSSFAQVRESRVEAEIVLDGTRVMDNVCYYDNQSYSRGALISTKVDNKTVQLKCDMINSFELNGALGWVSLSNESEERHPDKVTFTRE